MLTFNIVEVLMLYTHTGMLCNSIGYVYMSSFCDYQYVLLCIFKPCSSQPQHPPDA
jgi:hypothetical protein